MDRLGPTVDLYVLMLVQENQRLRAERDRARKSAWEARRARDLWRAKAALRRKARTRAEVVATKRNDRRRGNYLRGEGEYRAKAAA